MRGGRAGNPSHSKVYAGEEADRSIRYVPDRGGEEDGRLTAGRIAVQEGRQGMQERILRGQHAIHGGRERHREKAGGRQRHRQADAE